MGIKQDYAALRDSWASFTPFTKLFFSISFLITALSIASLGEHVAKLRGFIVTAVVFYRALTRPLVRILAVRQFTIDALVLLSVVVCAQWRATLVAKDRFIRMSPGEFRLLWLVMVTMAFTEIFTHSQDKQTQFAVAIFAAMIVTLLWDMVRAYCSHQSAGLKGKLLRILGIEDDETKRLQSKLQLSYIGAVVLFVAVIAAVSEGLMRLP